MSASEIGGADADLYKATWGSETPWQFFRGIYRNSMTDPGFTCEVLSAGPEEVQARCPEHFGGVVASNEGRYDVSVNDVIAYQ